MGVRGKGKETFPKVSFPFPRPPEAFCSFSPLRLLAEGEEFFNVHAVDDAASGLAEAG